jgi:formylglycine-generating enzyme required for sulfatase activity/dienelactone hydrolase
MIRASGFLLGTLLASLAAGGVPQAAPPKFPFDEAAARSWQKASAETLGVPVEAVGPGGIAFVLVPPGTFLMGSPDDEPGRKPDERLHPVTLTKPFYLAKHEVTVAQFRAFVEATAYVTDVERRGGGHAHTAKAVWSHTPGTSWRKPGYAGPFELRDDHPVVHVSVTDARAFCRWLGPEVRLPTEAEWEWACRAGSAARFWWGAEEDSTGKVVNAGDRAIRRVHPEWPRKTMPMEDGHAFMAPVGSYRPNAFGLHDMLGNVWEFCGTRHGAYPEDPVTDPGDLGRQESYDVRGGGWSNEPHDVRCAARNSDPPRFGHSNLGFRVAMPVRKPDEVAAAARALRPPGAPGAKAVLDALESRAKEALAAVDHPATKAAWEQAAPRLRRELRSALGLDRLGKPRSGNVRSAGTLDRGSYRIEKLVYETLPGMEVPAHLYLPAGEGKRPAVLFVPGHWYADSKTKADFQAFAINLARWGFVVLSYDPFGQGERGISLRDHRRTELLPLGAAQQAIVDFESIAALELLLSRPEVDPARIGMTGASGGGFNSWIVPSLDPRVAVTVPVVGTSEFYEQLSVVRERDWYEAKEHCHFVPRLLRFANNHEFLAMVAPRPLLVIAAHNDHGFRIPGNRAVVEYGRALYGALGAPERIGYFEDDKEGHGYQKAKREAAYGWFLKWLKGEGDGAAKAEPATEVPPWDAAELRCFPENRSSGPAFAALAKALLEGLPPRDPKVPIMAEHGGALPSALGMPMPVRLMSAPRLERGEAKVVAGVRLERVRWRMLKDEVEVPGVLLAPPGEWKGALLGASDSGKEALLEHGAVREALARGFAVVLADIRGTGENAHGRPGWVFAVSLLLGENFVGRQALDLVAGWRALGGSAELRGKPIALLGSGPHAALAALYASVLEPRVAGLATEGGFASYRDFIERPKSLAESYRLVRAGQEAGHRVDREIPADLVLWEALRRFDLADLEASLAPRPVAVLGAIDGDFQERPGRGSLAELFEKLPKEAVPAKPLGANPSAPVERGRFPNRVHAVEDYETDIERRWWMAGRIETANVPPGSRRACRGTLANDFDDRMGDRSQIYTAVIFNPVPGPPMGKNTRLSFRYWLRGSDQIRVQIYSLSNGYHRHLTLSGLPQGAWQECAVDMTRLRRPDGSGGPLAEDERIDDIQFYTDPLAELVIDDIVLYDAAAEGELLPFPRRILFAGGFDTGRQGKEWPGDFEIVSHEKPRTWKAARSVPNPAGGTWLRVGLRGSRPALGPRVRLRCVARPIGAELYLVSSGRRTGPELLAGLEPAGGWKGFDVSFAAPESVDEIRFVMSNGKELLVDDVILYEPGE